jgi:hypothetical protein
METLVQCHWTEALQAAIRCALECNEPDAIEAIILRRLEVRDLDGQASVSEDTFTCSTAEGTVFVPPSVALGEPEVTDGCACRLTVIPSVLETPLKAISMLPCADGWASVSHARKGRTLGEPSQATKRRQRR